MPDPTYHGAVDQARSAIARLEQSIRARDARIAELSHLYALALDDLGERESRISELEAERDDARRQKRASLTITREEYGSYRQYIVELEAQLSAVRAVRERLARSDDMLDADVVRWLDEALA